MSKPCKICSVVLAHERTFHSWIYNIGENMVKQIVQTNKYLYKLSLLAFEDI